VVVLSEGDLTSEEASKEALAKEQGIQCLKYTKFIFNIIDTYILDILFLFYL